MSKIKLIAAIIATAGAWLGMSSANAVTLQLQSQFFENTSDCSGYFGSGFDNCLVDGSPSIAKFQYNGGFTLSDTNSTYYPSITGSEWTFDGFAWTYTPGANDPAIRFWTSKNANDFTLFYWVDLDSGCGTSLSCAVAAYSGSVLSAGLSHVTFYDTGIPQVPEPTSLALLGLGLAGLGLARRRRA